MSFNIFKKKNINQNTFTDGSFILKNVLDIAKIISNNDSEVIEEINKLIKNKEKYINNNERGLDEHSNDNIIFWLIMVDVLEKFDYVCERDWKDEFEDFIYYISKLKTYNLNIDRTLFNENESIIEWCRIIDDTYKIKCIGCIDIDSDSYVLFISNDKEINQLKDLANEINKKIDYAKNC